MKRIVVAAILTAALALLGTAHADVNTLAWYRLGEADPAPVNGNTITSTQDSGLFNYDLSLRQGVPVYTNTGAVAGSTWAGDFERNDGAASNRDVLTNGVLTTVVDNFGVEAWIKLESTAGTQIIAHNGDTSNNGWGLLLYNNTLSYLYGKVVIGSTSVQPGLDTWMHVAFVRTNGVEMIYTNGALAAITSYTSGNANSAPITPGTASSLGGSIFPAGTDGLDGLLDEVRFFTFDAGKFQATDLLYFQAIPEPSALALVGFGLLGTWLLRRRRHS